MPEKISGIGSTPEERGADAGRQYAKALQEGRLADQDIEFEYRDPKLGKDPDGKDQLSVFTAKKFSEEALKGFGRVDKNGNVRVADMSRTIKAKIKDPDLQRKMLNFIDLQKNLDGDPTSVSPQEFTIGNIFQNSALSEPPYGTLTDLERKSTMAFGEVRPEITKGALKKIYDHYAERLK